MTQAIKPVLPDCIGNFPAIGDIVATSSGYGRGLTVGKVIKMNPKTFRIESTNRGYKREVNGYSETTILIRSSTNTATAAPTKTPHTVLCELFLQGGGEEVCEGKLVKVMKVENKADYYHFLQNMEQIQKDNPDVRYYLFHDQYLGIITTNREEN